ncbi:MAG: biotin--[acetyl-CoA-carboxylase] ligase [Jatrophihabitans sp.]
MQRAPLDVGRLRAALTARWTQIDVVDETASTNAELLARPDLGDRVVLAAEHQTSGRGRFERVWTSPPRAGLTFSATVRPQAPLARWGWLPLLAGVAMAEAVRDETGVAAALKWPNDLLLGGRKAAGILAQTFGAELVVIGIGLNVSTPRAQLPLPTATSLALEGATSLDRTALLVAILTRLDVRAAQWAEVGGDARACGLANAYRDLCATIGTRVRVSGADGSALEGDADDLDADGHLIVRSGGSTRTIGAGDVEHLRPA